MYADDPSWRGYFNLMHALYRRHPLRLDIAGTDASIAGLDRTLLDRVQRAYYHPRNLILTVAGDVDPAGVLALADEVLLPRRQGRRRQRPLVTEAHGVRRRLVQEPLAVSRPHVLLGIKETAPGSGRRLADRHVHTAMVLELLFGDGGRIEAPLYRDGVVDDSLAAGVEVEADYSHAVISAEVDDASAFRRRIESAVRAAAQAPPRAEEIERVRRKARGHHLRTFNAPEATAHWLLGQAIDDLPLSARTRAMERATPRVLDRRLKDLARAPRSWSVVRPRD